MADLVEFITAVEKDDCTTVQHMRNQFSDQKLGVALVDAARFNSAKVVAELLQNPSKDILVRATEALHRAAECGHIEILKIVLPHTNPKLNSNPLLWAVKNNHQQCVDVLFEVSDLDVAWELLNVGREYITDEAFSDFEQRMMARAQHAKLTEEVEHSGGMRGARKL